MASNYPPKKNVAFTMGFFIMKSDGTIIANPTLTGSNVHTDLGTTEVTNSTLAVVDSTTGLCSIALAQATMNGDQIDGTITSSSTGAVVYTFKIMTSAYTNDEIGADVAATHVHASAADAAVTHADYGLAKLVRSTTPANTLSVDAAHNVGIIRPSGTIVDDAGNSTTVFKTNLTSAEDDYIKDAYVKFTSGANINQVKKISAYNGTSKVITTAAFTDEPAENDTFIIINE